MTAPQPSAEELAAIFAVLLSAPAARQPPGAEPAWRVAARFESAGLSAPDGRG